MAEMPQTPAETSEIRSRSVRISCFYSTDPYKGNLRVGKTGMTAVSTGATVRPSERGPPASETLTVNLHYCQAEWENGRGRTIHNSRTITL
ncbi:uncharacterized [Tachysurus ichikawai]